jgi:hypothetical protein
MTQDWDQRLRKSYKLKAVRDRGRRVRLPKSGPMTVTGEGDRAIICLRRDTVVRNMQDDAAAFEGWSLALRRWCDAENVTLDWEDPGPELQPRNERHFQRFLYRVARFQSLFPEWFTVGAADAFRRSRVPASKRLFLNVPGDRRGIGKGGRPEHQRECSLLEDDDFKRHYNLGPTSMINRQFPVGLFSSEEPSEASALFPHKKAAIDLVCLDGTRLCLFELKADDNIPIGTLSELIFYTSFIRDAVAGRFRFPGGGQSLVRPDMIGKVTDITAVMLGDDYHPLLADARIIKMLNDAAALHWNGSAGAVVTFRADQIVSGKDEPLRIVARA